MKFKLNRAFREASGELDGLIYRNIRGKVIASPKPVYKGELSPAQQEHRVRFMRAVAYSRGAIANDEVRPMYEAIAEEKNIPIFAAIMSDFFNAPKIEYVDDLGYNGNSGDEIKILASDDCGVVKVHVKINDLSGNLIESGDAVDSGNGMGPWIYTTQYSMDRPVNVEVVATDRPGGTTVTTIRRDF